ncbi:N-acetylmuramoyl-L-alanine amidase [Sphingomonas sp. JC676]|uniref:peptidoglycan recognition protein family protein n=1 Tax=Sphingomonas sp. JC676 TaxID=2768065 RepID=UPI00165786AB|nr:N-acetylmuramoyl-L-alanine amidase [Sphingomonas sp. JC676]MBC9032228.1 N-acetylmuramoyl-L-alanine amidase [Sphingomonas sp. JC676]
MVFSLTWLPEVLEAAGLKVAETENWRSRGRAEMGRVRGVMCHHTATPGHFDKNMPTLDLLIRGRSDLAGPLAQLGLGRDGTFYVVAAGRANHAGAGNWEGITTGNSSFIGIEAENSGRDPWPDVQMDAYRRGVAAILKRIGAGASMCCGHKEYALPAGRKPDPTFDMALFRRDVSDLLAGKTPPPPIPAKDDDNRSTLRRGSRGSLVEQIQGLLNVEQDAIFGPNTEAAVRAFQRKADLVPDGIIGPKTWAVIAKDNPGTVLQAPTPAPIPTPTPTPIPAPVISAVSLPPPDDAAHPATVSADGKAFTPLGRQFAKTFKLGFVTSGTTSIESWLAARPQQPTASPSVLRIMKAVSVNEGLLDAVNSWDACFMSFGILQWTAGKNDEEGELPAMLDHLKRADPDAYAECFGRFGLEVRLAAPGATTGRLTLNGALLDSAAGKQQLRDVKWAYRFWRAGQHDAVRLAEFDFAAGRIKRFIDAPVLGRPLHAWISSELGIAQLLDEHTNRPGHVPGTLKLGLQALFGDSPPDPSGWTNADERRLIAAYLKARHARTKSKMTDSEARAGRIEAMAEQGKLSAARGSFVA